MSEQGCCLSDDDWLLSCMLGNQAVTGKSKHRNELTTHKGGFKLQSWMQQLPMLMQLIILFPSFESQIPTTSFELIGLKRVNTTSAWS